MGSVRVRWVLQEEWDIEAFPYIDMISERRNSLIMLVPGVIPEDGVLRVDIPLTIADALRRKETNLLRLWCRANNYSVPIEVLLGEEVYSLTWGVDEGE